MQGKSEEIKVVKSVVTGLLCVLYLYFVVVFGTLGVVYYVHDFPTTSMGWNQVLRN